MQSTGDAVQCAKCQSAEIDGSGTCMVCGYLNRNEPVAEIQEALPLPIGPFEIESSVSDSGGHGPPPELPQWRLELSRRLQEIKHKRESTLDSRGMPADAPPAPVPDVPPEEEQTPVLPGALQQAGPAPRPAIPPPGATVVTQAPAPEPDQTVEDIRTLIDRMVQKPEAAEGGAEPEPEEPRAEPVDYRALLAGSEPVTDRLILLSRTFSGLVDLLIVILVGSGLVFAVDVIEGIEVFDTISLLNYLILLIATFVVYSAFFLITANQTIGMMITDLRIVGCSGTRPTPGQIFIRSLAYLVALGAAGLGLVCGLFDSETRCLHDRLSDTRVVRILPY